jgi:heat shock protein HslJ
MPILAAVLAAILGTGTFVVVKVATTANACKLLQAFADQPEYSMILPADTQLNDQLTHTDIQVSKTQVGGHTVIDKERFCYGTALQLHRRSGRAGGNSTCNRVCQDGIHP